jgi:hypothetical protein
MLMVSSRNRTCKTPWAVSWARRKNRNNRGL